MSKKRKFDYSQIEDFLEIELAQDRIESWRQLTLGQYRINEKVDIYPRSKKYFYVPSEERGDYENLSDFLELIL